MCLAYLQGGIVRCLTIVGIPSGIQCFELSIRGLAPFGTRAQEGDHPGGVLAILMNVNWIVLPFATQHMKLTQLALLPAPGPGRTR